MVLFSRIPEVVLAGKGKLFTLLIFINFFCLVRKFWHLPKFRKALWNVRGKTISRWICFNDSWCHNSLE